MSHSLTERPAPGEVITVTATVEDLPGNTESLVPHVATRARTANFVADDFGRQFVGAVNVSGALPRVHRSWLVLRALQAARWLSWLHIASDARNAPTPHRAICGAVPVSHRAAETRVRPGKEGSALCKCASKLNCLQPI